MCLGAAFLDLARRPLDADAALLHACRRSSGWRERWELPASDRCLRWSLLFDNDADVGDAGSGGCLRASGFDNAAVLDGGFEKWKAEGRPIEAGVRHYPPAELRLILRCWLRLGR